MLLGIEEMEVDVLICKSADMFMSVSTKSTQVTAIDLLRWLITFIKPETMSDTQLNLIPIICSDVAVILFSENFTCIRQKHSTEKVAVYFRQTNFKFDCNSTVSSQFNITWFWYSMIQRLNKHLKLSSHVLERWCLAWLNFNPANSSDTILETLIHIGQQGALSQKMVT
jgi:hypothetical protein